MATAKRKAAWLAIVVLVLTLVGSPTWIWLDHSLSSPLHQSRECRVAALAAVQLALNFDRINKKSPARLRMRGPTFSPVLFDQISDEGEAQALPKWPSRLRGLLLAPSQLDCTAEFREHNLPVGQFPRDHFVLDYPHIYSRFSRVVFSGDGRYAYLIGESVCGLLCGTGTEVRLVRNGNGWKWDNSKTKWIS